MLKRIAQFGCVGVLALGGCQQYYYKFTDNQTKKDFYQGPYAFPPDRLPISIALRDPVTGAVTVTNQYTVTPITQTEFQAVTASRSVGRSKP